MSWRELQQTGFDVGRFRTALEVSCHILPTACWGYTNYTSTRCRCETHPSKTRDVATRKGKATRRRRPNGGAGWHAAAFSGEFGFLGIHLFGREQRHGVLLPGKMGFSKNGGSLAKWYLQLFLPAPKEVEGVMVKASFH